MRRNIYAAILLLTGAVMAACSSSDDITSNTTPESQAPTGNGAVELSGTLGCRGELTRTIAADGVGTWEIGDQFAIYYATESGHSTAVATVNSINDNGSANFTATLYYPKNGSSDVTLVYPVSAHDGQGGFNTDALMNQEGTLDYINANGLDIETASTTLNIVDTKASLNSDVTMQPQVCLYTLNPVYNLNYHYSLSVKKLEINDGTHNYIITPTDATSSLTIALLPTNSSDFTFSAITDEYGPSRIYTKRKVTLANCTADNVGDVFDEDGNIYSVSSGTGLSRVANFSGITLEKGKFYSQEILLTKIKRPVAMIAYVGEHGSVDDSSTDSQTGFHGLAIAMQNSTKSNTTEANNNWDADTWGYPRWCSWNDDQDDNLCTTQASDNVTVVREWKNGITMTNQLVNHNHMHGAARIARNYSTFWYEYDSSNYYFSNSSVKMSLPKGVSKWFLPSVGQWQLIVWGLVSKAKGEPYSTLITDEANADMTAGNFNSILANAGAENFKFSCDHYWLSSEYSKDKAWVAAYNGRVCGADKSYVTDAIVRAVIAF
jgi:hypothetical protein